MRQTSLAVIGAGPYGIATAVHAKERQIDTVVVGRPMELWNVPLPPRPGQLYRLTFVMALKSERGSPRPSAGIDCYQSTRSEGHE